MTPMFVGRAKLWQLLTVDTGIPHLDEQITTVTTLMQISPDKQTFEQHFENLFNKQKRLPYPLPVRALPEATA